MKAHKIQTAARNLGTIVRALFGIGPPRALQSTANQLLDSFGRGFGALWLCLNEMASDFRSKIASGAISDLTPIKFQAMNLGCLRLPASTVC